MAGLFSKIQTSERFKSLTKKDKSEAPGFSGTMALPATPSSQARTPLRQGPKLGG